LPPLPLALPAWVGAAVAAGVGPRQPGAASVATVAPPPSAEAQQLRVWVAAEVPSASVAGVGAG
jgi:hypothetical protein